MTLEEWLTVLAPFLQQKLASYPALAGLLWAAAVLWNGGVPLGEQRLQMERQGHGVNPFCRTRRKVNFPALIRKPPQTQQEADILSSNAVFWYSTPLR